MSGNSHVVINDYLNNAQRITVDDVFASRTPEERVQRRTKIVCTLGPACNDPDILAEMMDAGMDICRFNFSHGDHQSHKETLNKVKEALAKRPGKVVGLLLDTKGPEIRTGFFKEGKKTVELKKNQQLKLVTDYNYKGDETCIACTYQKLPTTVNKGSQILMADGSVTLEVTECGKDYVMTRILNNAKIGERKNMNLPGAKVDLPVCGEREVKDFLEFGIPNGMHYIAASFVQCAQDIRDIRKILGTAGKHFKIIPKIENQEGIINFDEILRECDGVMIARGDMGMEIPLEKVFLAQKMIITKCNIAGKPVIVATQMLESMINAPRPTRAEVSDVANAVLDGCDAVMLSGESANGAFPVRAVDMLARTAFEAESILDYKNLFKAIHSSVHATGTMSKAEAVASSAVEAAEDVKATVIVAVTETGYTARLIAKYKPRQMIIAVSKYEITNAQLSYVRGVVPLHFNDFADGEKLIQTGINFAIKKGFAKTGDAVVVVHGLKKEGAGNTGVMKIVIA